MAVSLFFYYCCPLNVMNQEKDWAKMVQEAMPPGYKACLI